MEWLLLLPKPGFFPQMTQTLDIVGSSLLDLPARESKTVCTRGLELTSPVATDRSNEWACPLIHPRL